MDARLDVQPLRPHAVASPAALYDKKHHAHEEEEDADYDHVHLRSTWVFSSLRNPLWRLAVCWLRLIFCFLVCVTSPLLTSHHAPPAFPIYGDVVSIVFTRVTPAKLLLHGAVVAVVVVFVRLVVYRLVVEDAWNWARQYTLARQTFTRLSGLPATSGDASTSRRGSTTIALQVFKSGTSDAPATRVRVHAAPRAQGSWTLTALLLPALWWAVASVLRRLVVGTAYYEELFFGVSSQAAALPQWEVQLALYNTLMALNAVSLVVTLDEILQDKVHCGRALATLRRAYSYSNAVRVLWCWTIVAVVAVGGVYFGGFSLVWAWCLESWSSQAKYVPLLVGTLTSEAWRSVLSGLVVVLDLVWLVQDWHFPGFAAPVGTKMFGFHRDFVRIPMLRGKTIDFTSKWTSVFVVLGLLLPLDVCNFYQEYAYHPTKFAQVVSVASGYRVFPLSNTTVNELHVIQQLAREGSIGRFSLQSPLDQVPAIVCVVMMMALFAWLHGREQWRMRYTAFLGQPTRVDQEAANIKINAAVSASTREALKAQMRLFNLYRVRSQFDLLGACLAIVSVGSVVFQVRSIWRSSNDAPSDADITAGETYGVLLVAISALMVYQLYHRYAVKYEILVLRNRIGRGSSRWWRGTQRALLLYPFVAEVMLSALCLPPFLHGKVEFDEERYFMIPSKTNRVYCPARMVPGTVDDDGYASCDLRYSYPVEVLNLYVLVRLYWLIRLLRNELFGRLFADHGALLVTAGIGGNIPSEISSLRWSFRMCLSLIPVRVIFGIFLILWTGTSAAVSILERPFPSLLDNEEHSLWLTIVTISGVGYGDAYPLTAFGRLSILLGAVIGGAVVVSLMTSIFLDTLKGSKDEHKFVQQLERIMWEKKLRHLSATLIAFAWKAHKYRLRENSREKDGVFQWAHKFKAARKRYRPKETFENLEQLRISSIAKWRTTQMVKWTEESRQQRNQLVDMMEREVSALEAALQPLLKKAQLSRSSSDSPSSNV